MLNRDITLHILTDAEFRFNKPNASRQFLGKKRHVAVEKKVKPTCLIGLDARTGYTPKEIKGRLVGDADLRRQSKFPRSAIGVCASLALETNGIVTLITVRTNVTRVDGS